MEVAKILLTFAVVFAVVPSAFTDPQTKKGVTPNAAPTAVFSAEKFERAFFAAMASDPRQKRQRPEFSAPLSAIARKQAADMVQRVLALELGAADVVERDIAPRELAARIGGLVTRKGKRGQGPDLVVLENATVDLKAALVMRRSGEEEMLSPGQVALLRLFVSNARKVLSREDIIASAPAEAADAFDRSIDSRIVRLRRKLDTESIVTIRGAGYRYEPPQMS